MGDLIFWGGAIVWVVGIPIATKYALRCLDRAYGSTARANYPKGREGTRTWEEEKEAGEKFAILVGMFWPLALAAWFFSELGRRLSQALSR